MLVSLLFPSLVYIALGHYISRLETPPIDLKSKCAWSLKDDMVGRSETGRDVKLLVDSTSCNILNWNMFWLIIVGYFAFKQPIVCGKFENMEKLNVEMQRFHRKA